MDPRANWGGGLSHREFWGDSERFLGGFKTPFGRGTPEDFPRERVVSRRWRRIGAPKGGKTFGGGLIKISLLKKIWGAPGTPFFGVGCVAPLGAAGKDFFPLSGTQGGPRGPPFPVGISFLAGEAFPKGRGRGFPPRGIPIREDLFPRARPFRTGLKKRSWGPAIGGGRNFLNPNWGGGPPLSLWGLFFPQRDSPLGA